MPRTAYGAVLPAVGREIGQILSKAKNDNDAMRRQVYERRAKQERKVDPITILESLDLHDQVKNASAKLFVDGHYPQSILEAFKTLNNYVKSKSGQTELDGKPLMSKVFSRDNPILSLNKLESTSDRDEQEGFMFLYMGAMVGIRNPKAHETVEQNDPFKTLEYLALASLLAKRVDEAKKVDVA